jgi:serine/threonine-protein kinase
MRPSAIVLKTDEATETNVQEISNRRGTLPPLLHRTLEGDLDAIILMALKKEPDRRYGTAGEFLEDLRRYMQGHPVVAQDDTFRYRAAKFVRRHSLQVTAAALALLFLVAGIITTTWQALERQQQAVRANEQAARAIATRDYIIQTFALVDPDELVNTDQALDDTFTVYDLIAKGLSRMDVLRDSLDRAAVMDIMGQVSISFQLFDKADSLYRQALSIKRALLGPSHPDLAESLYGLAVVALNRSAYAEAEQYYRRTETLLLQADGIARERIPVIENNLGSVIYYQNDEDRVEEMKAWYERSFATSSELMATFSEDPDVLQRLSLHQSESLEGLANVLCTIEKRFTDADSLYDRARSIRIEELGADHSKVANSLLNKALCLRIRGDTRGAILTLQEAKWIYEKHFGSIHLTVAHCLYSLGLVYQVEGDSIRAEQHFREAIHVYNESRLPRARIEPSYPRIALADQMVAEDRWAEAEPFDVAVLQALEDGEYPADYDIAMQARISLGRCLIELEQYERAEEVLLVGQSLLSTHGDTRRHRQTLEQLISLYTSWSRPEQALRYRSRLDSLQTLSTS